MILESASVLADRPVTITWIVQSLFKQPPTDPPSPLQRVVVSYICQLSFLIPASKWIRETSAFRSMRTASCPPVPCPRRRRSGLR